DTLELPGAHIEHEADTRRHAFVKPDVRNGHGQFDVPHSFAADTSQRNLNAAPVADNALMLNAFVFSAGTFPIARGTKNAFAEKAALLRFKGPVINCLGIFDFAFAPRAHRVTRRDANRDLIKTHGPFFAH